MDILKKLYQNVKQFPHKIAIKGNNKAYTYQEFDTITTCLAHKINKMIGYEKNVIIDGDNSVEVLCAIYAVLKSGNTYVPISPNQAKTRRRMIIEDSNPSLFIATRGETREQNNHLPILMLDADVINRYQSHKETEEFSVVTFPYILYTSGSTGKPKGVRSTAQNLSYILENLNNLFPGKRQSNYLFSTPFVFDVSITEIFGFVINASTLVIVHNAQNTSLERVVSTIADENITHFSVSPAFLNTILTSFSKAQLAQFAKHLEFVLVAGEKFNVNILKQWSLLKNKKCRLFNCYGPTETTVYAFFHEVNIALESDLPSIPIGTPLLGVDFKIDHRDSRGVGELIIYGEGVAAGYYNQSSQAFGVEDGTPFYRTGDMVRLDEGNNLQFIGRKDNQLQINGIRVELAEIELNIEECDSVDNALVMEIDQKIIAFIQTRLKKEAATDNLRTFLNASVPRYLHPNTIIVYHEFPLTTSQKVDREALKAKYYQELGKDFKTQTLSKLESDVISIFSKVFNIPTGLIDVHSNFFDLGGNSLTATLAAIMLEDLVACPIEETILYQYPTVKKLSKWIEEKIASIAEVSFEQSETFIDKNTLRDELQAFIQNIDSLASRTFPAGPVPSYYFNKHFEAILKFKLHLDKKMDIKELRESIYNVLKREELLMSSMVALRGSIYFRQHHFLKKVLPYFKVQSQREWDHIDNSLEQLNEELILNARYHGNLLYYLCVVEWREQFYILGAFDHCIFDQASIAIFQRKLLEAIAHHSPSKEEEHVRYSDYIQMILAKLSNQKQYQNSTYIQQLRRSHKELIAPLLDTLPKQPTYYKVEEMFHCDVILNSLYSAFVVSKKFCDDLGAPMISLLLFLDGRKLYAENIDRMLGDLHSEVPIVYFKGESFTEFSHRIRKILTSDIASKGIMPMEFAFNEMKVITDFQRELQWLMKDNITILVNFIGVMSPKDYQSFQESIFDLQNRLEVKSKLTRIYVTSVICNGNLYIHCNRYLGDDK